MYDKYKLLTAIESFKDSNFIFDTSIWLRIPGEGCTDVFTGCLKLQGTSCIQPGYILIEPPEGSSMCLAGFLALKRLRELSTNSSDSIMYLNYKPTPNLAIDYLKVWDTYSTQVDRYHDTLRIEDTLMRIFLNSSRIRTLDGMKRKLKEAGLL